MSWWTSLFGGGGKTGATPAELPGEDYKGFTIRAAPFKAGALYQTAGVIAKVIDGVRREHHFVRADTHSGFDDAVSFSLGKARQMIDHLGDRVFDS